MDQYQFVQSPSESEADHIATRVIEIFEDIRDTDGQHLPPLYDDIDPEALDRLVTNHGRDMGSLRVEFAYLNHVVTVRGDGRITVESLDSSEKYEETARRDRSHL